MQPPTPVELDSEAMADYVFIWNYHHAEINNEPLERHGEAFF